MEEKKKVILNKEIYESDFYHNLLKVEFQKLIYENILEENQLQIFSSYIYENDYEIEAGIYIINSSENEVQVNNLPLCFYSGEEKIGRKDLEVNETLNSNSAVFKELKINKKDITCDYKINNISIVIDDISNIRKYPYINIDINNLPEIKEYINYKDIKKFLKNLSVIEEDQLAIDIFRNGEIETGFYMIMLFRNSSKREITLKSIPLEVYTEGNLLVYKNTFRVSDDSLRLPGNSGKMMVITIPRKDFPFIEGEDLNNYKVKIR